MMAKRSVTCSEKWKRSKTFSISVKEVIRGNKYLRQWACIWMLHWSSLQRGSEKKLLLKQDLQFVHQLCGKMLHTQVIHAENKIVCSHLLVQQHHNKTLWYRIRDCSEEKCVTQASNYTVHLPIKCLKKFFYFAISLIILSSFSVQLST